MMAIDMHRAMQQINEEFGHGLRLRIGMHSGSVLGGIMGTKKLNFDLWGETVEMANRMEEDGVPERIHVSEPVFVFPLFLVDSLIEFLSVSALAVC